MRWNNGFTKFEATLSSRSHSKRGIVLFMLLNEGKEEYGWFLGSPKVPSYTTLLRGRTTEYCDPTKDHQWLRRLRKEGPRLLNSQGKRYVELIEKSQRTWLPRGCVKKWELYPLSVFPCLLSLKKKQPRNKIFSHHFFSIINRTEWWWSWNRSIAIPIWDNGRARERGDIIGRSWTMSRGPTTSPPTTIAGNVCMCCLSLASSWLYM